MRREDHLSPRTLGDCGVRASRRYLWASLVAALVAWASTPAHAGFVSGSFKIDIAESERLLEAMLDEERGEITVAQLHAIQMEEMCKNPSIRLIDRNRPALVLQNTTSALSPQNEISQFTIDLQEMGFEFGNGDFNPDPFVGMLTILSNRSDPGITLASSYGTVSDSDLTEDRSKLVLDIVGLTPGKAMFFRLDLDPNPMTTVAFPDYRHVMLGADVGDGNGPAAPALISALFAAGEGSDRMTTATSPSEFNPGIEEILTMSGLIEGYHSQASSQRFSTSGNTIPEPSTVMLLLAGLAGLSRTRRSLCR
ncbi:MAG: PEP-CTERM sorting domain-containing protein [Planctomycetes bacterium]|nr:PEP-CTERM sorting domain-containing protein [Planctomycetota bacterium]